MTVPDAVGTYLQYGGVGGLFVALVVLFMRSMRFVDSRNTAAMAASTAAHEQAVESCNVLIVKLREQNALLAERERLREAELDAEHGRRRAAEEDRAVAVAQVKTLSQQVKDLSAAVDRLRDEVRRLRQGAT